MKIIKTAKYIHLKPTQESVNEFINSFKKNYVKFRDQHIIIDFSEKINMKIEELMLFLEISVIHKESGTSFVLVSKGVNIDEIIDKINIVPTFNEALDILEMDAIERDLGF